ncbi:ABC transporter substrate-binding protein [bacterium]|nr:ABC transporter substrate-binding protein [bacterium]
MKKIFIYKFLISLFLIFFNASFSFAENKFVSLSPNATEIFYELNAQNQLLAISTACTYPEETKNKLKVGNTFFIDKEKILKLKPNYIIAPDSTAPMLTEFNKLNIKPICYKYKTVNDIFSIILDMGKLTDKNQSAQKLVQKLKNDIEKSKTKKPKDILYLVQVQPMITVGKESFITDVIKVSGQNSITKDFNSYYPTISEEFAIKSNPDVVVVSFYSDTQLIKKFFPNAKIIFMSQEQNDIINRPGPRINKSIKFFADL